MPISTRIISVVRNELNDRALVEAARVIRSGGLVAFPTETVYGLGADATHPAAVARIFEAKGRPSTNPLIVHVDDEAMARTCVSDWPEAARLLSRQFWPGPLTLVLPRSGIIPDLITAGLDTVGLRVPRRSFARHLITRTGRPIAAPSANRSNAISPTAAEHVHADLDGRIELIIDGGPTQFGIESTVLDLTAREPRVLRPGPVSAREIEAALPGVPVRDAGGGSPSGPAMSPGQLAVHYAPRAPAVRVDSPADLAGFPWPAPAALLVFDRQALPTVPESVDRFDLDTPDAAAQALYAVLHRCDALGVGLIVVVPPPDRPEWHAVRDRLWRATRPWP